MKKDFETAPAQHFILLHEDAHVLESTCLAVNGEFAALKKASWTTARIDDTATWPEDKQAPEYTADDIVSHKELLAALVDPATGARNLSSVWDRNVSELLKSIADDGFNDVSLEIAEGRSSTGLAVTTLQTLSDDQKDLVPVHIILNTETGKGLIVGESVPQSLSAAFNKAGIRYVNRNTKTAQAKVEKALEELTEGSAVSKRSLKHAFGYRHVITTDERSLPELLLDGAVKPSFSKFPIKNRKLAA